MSLIQKQTVQGLSLKGSVAVVKDYLTFALSSILYQRDVFEPDAFEMVNKYGLPLMIMKDDSKLKYLINDAEKALSEKGLRQLILVLFEKNTDTIIEKWEFNIESENKETNNNLEIGSKCITVIQADIRAVLKQVLGSVSFLPLIEKGSDFIILLNVEPGFTLPGWKLYTGSLAIDNNEEFVFKDFTTSMHKCETKVTYKN